MAAEANTGMDRADMKRLLMVSKTEPVNCSFAQGKEPATALLLLHKIKQPRALQKDLEKDFPDAKNARFGTAVVDPDENPKLVKFLINKAVSGMARRLVKTLKGTGYTKVVILLEDGTPVEEASGEEEEGETEEAAPSQAAAPPPPPPPPPQAAAPVVDAGAVAQELKALVERVAAITANSPAQRAELLRFAQQAQANLKANNLTYAAVNVRELQAALEAAEAARANKTAPEAPASAAGAVAYAKSRLAWIAARRRMEADIERLRGELVSTYEAEGTAADIEQRFRARVAPLLESLDESLADALDAAGNATDPAERARLVAEARTIIARYQGVLASEPLIADLDDNPFVPLSIGKTLGATLTTLAAAVR